MSRGASQREEVDAVVVATEEASARSSLSGFGESGMTEVAV